MMETPLLSRDENYELTSFWSPTRRPSIAPPSSPRLSTYELEGHRSGSPPNPRTLAYLDHQLNDVVYQAKIPKHASRQALQNHSPSQHSPEVDDEPTMSVYSQHFDDDVTLTGTSSPLLSETSEVYTLSDFAENLPGKSLE